MMGHLRPSWDGTEGQWPSTWGCGGPRVVLRGVGWEARSGRRSSSWECLEEPALVCNRKDRQ
eukprot:122259-Pelagomonas_calceolata.AAC.1